jgi:Zn-dependent M16 (insulinase) family peptidase
MTRDQVINAAEKYFATTPDRQAVAVISNENKLNEANKELAKNPLKLFRI